MTKKALKDPVEMQKIKQDSYSFRENYANSMQIILDQLENTMKENNIGIF